MLSFLFSLMPMTTLTLHNGGLLYRVLLTAHFWKYPELQEKFPKIRDCQSLHFEMIKSFLMVRECQELGTEIHASPYFNSKHPIADGSSQVSFLCLFLPT